MYTGGQDISYVFVSLAGKKKCINGTLLWEHVFNWRSYIHFIMFSKLINIWRKSGIWVRWNYVSMKVHVTLFTNTLGIMMNGSYLPQPSHQQCWPMILVTSKTLLPTCGSSCSYIPFISYLYPQSDHISFQYCVWSVWHHTTSTIDKILL